MKRTFIRITLVIILFTGAVIIVIGALVRHAPGRKLREAILAELQPVALKNCTFKRFGSANDGGYLMCENLIEPLDAGYSYGVGSNDDWACVDIEGAEWDSLLTTPNELLASIPQITMEMHGYDDPKIVEVLRKLNRDFFLVNLHFNNWSCTSKAAPLPAWAYQTHWVNKHIGVLDSAAPVPAPMNRLNAPDSPTWPDCQLSTPRSQR
ncbi:MAG: hypothetical protein DME89_06785 [Verrucomicrobia bacterium]|nr:MAG: hypothetical protein DME89_06785 [Verrucomicrobiota bacterium]